MNATINQPAVRPTSPIAMDAFQFFEYLQETKSQRWNSWVDALNCHHQRSLITPFDHAAIRSAAIAAEVARNRLQEVSNLISAMQGAQNIPDWTAMGAIDWYDKSASEQTPSTQG